MPVLLLLLGQMMLGRMLPVLLLVLLAQTPLLGQTLAAGQRLPVGRRLLVGQMPFVDRTPLRHLQSIAHGWG